MTAISKRLQKLEKMLATQPIEKHPWGSMVKIRDELLRRPDREGEAHAVSIGQELDDLGPAGFWLEIARSLPGASRNRPER
jgi:hypothetical protein